MIKRYVFMVFFLVLLSTIVFAFPDLDAFTYDGFETGNLNGGTGWTDTSWYRSATDAFVMSSEYPAEGTYHLRIQKTAVYIERHLDLYLYAGSTVTLKFYYKGKSLRGNSGVAYMYKSNTDTSPLQLFRWYDSDDTYRQCAIILPSEYCTSTARIKFAEEGATARAYIYVDSIQFTGTAGTPTPEVTPAPTPDPGQIVATYGNLQINDTTLQDQGGNPVQLRGMSSHGIVWFPWEKSTVTNLSSLWNVQIVRAAMYTTDPWNNPSGAYCDDYPANVAANEALVNKVVQGAIDAGVYVIVDWHILDDGDPNLHKTEAAQFFTNMSNTLYNGKKYSEYPNIIWEICNEPNGISWYDAKKTDIKEYADYIIPIIRNLDTDAYKNIIIVGTPTWCQDVDVAAATPLDFDNVAYSLHFYAGTHGSSLRAKAETALSTLVTNNKLKQTIWISEWGTGNADASPGLYLVESNTWLEWAKQLNLSWCNWSWSSKDTEDISALHHKGYPDRPYPGDAQNEIEWRADYEPDVFYSSYGYPNLMRSGPWSKTYNPTGLDLTRGGFFVMGWIDANTSQSTD